MGLSVNYKRERCVIISNGKCSKYIIKPEIKSTRENLSHSGDQGKSLQDLTKILLQSPVLTAKVQVP